jgi:nickel/cobalt exporter
LAFGLFAIAGADAQIAHHPFAIGASEGAVGRQSGLGAWILGQESAFYRHLTGAVRDTRASAGAGLGLVALSFGYGIFHAAGPGHGKAVIASYLVSNEAALKRGLVIALLAALLQGVVATGLVGVAAFVFNATAPRMTAAAETLELASYGGIVALGLALVWRKGRALLAAPRPAPEASSLVLAGVGAGFAPALPATSRFSVDDGSTAHVHGPDCGHVHMPDPSALSAARFDWKAAGITVLTAGARPCSGAILVLVFSLAQGIFLAGVAATFAMSLGTALTTGALATAAVFAKDVAVRLSGIASGRAVVVGRLVELVAGACVLAFGIGLLGAALAGVHAGG